MLATRVSSKKSDTCQNKCVDARDAPAMQSTHGQVRSVQLPDPSPAAATADRARVFSTLRERSPRAGKPRILRDDERR